MNVPHLQLGISDAALIAASTNQNGEANCALHASLQTPPSCAGCGRHAEMVAGFPSGRLFLDSVEQAMASLGQGHAEGSVLCRYPEVTRPGAAKNKRVGPCKCKTS